MRDPTVTELKKNISREELFGIRDVNVQLLAYLPSGSLDPCFAMHDSPTGTPPDAVRRLATAFDEDNLALRANVQYVNTCNRHVASKVIELGGSEKRHLLTDKRCQLWFSALEPCR
jgi:hypothetical protein